MECIFCEWWLMIIIFLIKSFYDNVYIIVKWVDEWFVYGYLLYILLGDVVKCYELEMMLF